MISSVCKATLLVFSVCVCVLTFEVNCISGFEDSWDVAESLPLSFSHTHTRTLTHTHTHTDRMWSVGLGLATGMALVMGAIKYRHGTYLPPLPQPHRPPGAEPLTPRDNNNSS